MKTHFSGKIAIITGGASGIGLELGKQLVSQGATVYLTDLNEIGLREAGKSLESLSPSGNLILLPLDVRDAHAVKKVVDDAVAAHGKLDLIFNNAGWAIMGEIRDMMLEDWRQILETNLMGVIHGVHAAYPHMVKQGFGHIVNMGSIAGLHPNPGLAAYGTTKHAITGLSNSLRAEAASLGVKVSMICPGLIDTPFFDAMKILNQEKVGFSGGDMVRKLPIKPYATDRCARVILRGIRKNDPIILVTRHAFIMSWMYRLFPRIALWTSGIAHRYTRRILRNYT